MDIYAKAKYNKYNNIYIVDIALKPQNDRDKSRASPNEEQTKIGQSLMTACCREDLQMC